MSLNEVDDIILHSLRSLDGVDVGDASSVEDLTPATVLKAVLVCLKAIDDGSEFSGETPIPRNMGSRVSLCSSVCEAIKNLGYRDSLGYHQLIYKSGTDNRRLLAWLISRLPNSEAGASSAERRDAVAEALAAESKELWSFPFTHSVRRRVRYADVRALATAPLLSPAQHYYAGVPAWSDQPPAWHQAAPSVLEYNTVWVQRASEWEQEWNSRGMASGLSQKDYRDKKAANVGRLMATAISSTLAAHAAASDSARGRFFKKAPTSTSAGKLATRFSQQIDFAERTASGSGVVVASAVSKEEREAERARQRAAELDGIEARLHESQESLNALVSQMDNFRSSYQQMTANLFAEQQRHDSLAQDLSVKRQTMKLLPKADENMQRLRELADQQSERIQALAAQWETERQQLVAAYRALRNGLKNQGLDAHSLLDEIGRLRADIDAVKESSARRYERYKQLSEVWNGLPKNISRETYTVRILDIVRQTKKQKVDIDKILIDTRNINHEINNVSQTLLRSFSVTSELVFTEATKDPVMKQAYRDLASLDRCFKQLVERVGLMGQLKRDMLTLEEKHTQLEKRTATINIDQIQQDLAELRREQ